VDETSASHSDQNPANDWVEGDWQDNTTDLNIENQIKKDI
jgi:hypothetical protein